MAIIKLAAPVAGIRGSVGGIIYSANQSGPYARAYAKGADPRSQKQTTQRATLAGNTRAWADLSDAQRLAWDTWAALPAQAKTNPLGETYYCSGFQWFVTVQNWLATVGRVPTFAPPAGLRPIAPTITSLTIDVDGAPESNILYPAGEFGLGPPVKNITYNTCRDGLDDATGTAWVNPTRIRLKDGSLATLTLAAFATSSRLKAIGYLKTIPLDATITGIRADWIYTETLLTHEVGLLKAGAPAGTVKTTAGTVDGDYRYWGGDGDLWGTTWTPAQVNDNTSGSFLRMFGDAFGGLADADHEKHQVWWTPELPPPYDCIIEVFAACSPGNTTKTSSYRLLIATQTPGNTTVTFQAQLEALAGTPVTAAKYFARVYRQSVDGYRSLSTTITDIAA